ncbi:hypothetical protein L3X38_021672 [Prunus dulcis]|uniref:Uncharacterized protein n=1 Tax=Prunus dulcis TaxID=3755 RepID=A0AAD4VX10_PRUDU|nr:hypothetical protein L3X38_021672 [Prunus dulcis]
MSNGVVIKAVYCGKLLPIPWKVLVSGSGNPVPVDFTSETQANSGCGDGLIPDDLENDKPHDNIEVYVEHNNLRHDDVPHDNLQFDEMPRASLQFDNVLHDSLQFDVPCDNMQLDVSLNPPNSPPCAGYSLKLTEKGLMGY